MGLLWRRYRFFHWLLRSCAGEWVKIRSPIESHSAIRQTPTKMFNKSEALAKPKGQFSSELRQKGIILTAFSIYTMAQLVNFNNKKMKKEKQKF